MKSPQITQKLKELFRVGTNDEIIPAIEKVLASKVAAPFGAIVIAANGQFTSTPFGLSNPPTLAEIETLQRAFRSLADLLDGQKVELIKAQVMAEMSEAGEK